MNRYEIQGSKPKRLARGDGERIGIDSTLAAVASIITYFISKAGTPDEINSALFVVVFALCQLAYRYLTDTRFYRLG